MLAAGPAQAVEASPLVLLCLLDYAAADEVRGTPGVSEAVRGRTLVQFSTGSPGQALAQQAWVVARGGRFLAGGIMSYPASIGQPDCLILYAGDKSFAEHRPTLAALGGSLQYLGENPTLAIGAYFTLSSFMIGALGLFYETAALARYYGVDMDSYFPLVRIVADQVLVGMRDGAHRIATRNFDGRLASIDLTVAGMQEVCNTFRHTGIPAGMTEALVAQLGLASERGDGDKDISRLFETLSGERRG